MNTIELKKPASTLSEIEFNFLDRQYPEISEGECLVEVHAAAINPSDIKAALGAFDHATWPRIPGRDYAGVVVNGAEDWFGKDVWGSGGDLGITQDGTFSRYLRVSVDALSKKPKNLSMLEAASVGVPFVTSYHALVNLAKLNPGELLVVFGANGQVGLAAMQVVKLLGGKVIGVTREAMAAFDDETLLNTKENRILESIDTYTKGKGADVVLNCVGKPYFEAAQACLGEGGRHILLSTLQPEDEVNVNVLEFYRKSQHLLGLNTMNLGHVEAAKILNVLRPAFEESALSPTKIDPAYVFSLNDAERAFSAVMEQGAGKCLFEL